jgi:hypothetical protein
VTASVARRFFRLRFFGLWFFAFAVFALPVPTLRRRRRETRALGAAFFAFAALFALRFARARALAGGGMRFGAMATAPGSLMSPLFS